MYACRITRLIDVPRKDLIRGLSVGPEESGISQIPDHLPNWKIRDSIAD